MPEIKRTSAFKTDVKKVKNAKVIGDLKSILGKLLIGESLPEKYRLHKLSGNFSGCCECHIRPDLLLVFEIKDDVLYLHRLGSHSDLFG